MFIETNSIMKHKVLFYLFFLVLPILVSCENEEDASDVAIFVKAEIPETVSVGSYLQLDITIYTPNEYIKEVIVSTFDADKGENIVYTTTPHTQKYNEEYVYRVPQVSRENTEIKLYITGVDNLGNRERYVIPLVVVGSDLKEYSSIEIFNPLSGNNDGINTQTKSAIRKETLSLSDEIYSFWLHQYEEEETSDLMPLEWNTTITDGIITFVLSNSFNYAEATSASLKSVYDSSNKNNYIKDIKAGDIILIGVNNEAWGAVKVIYIVDEEGVANDKMILNIKTMN